MSATALASIDSREVVRCDFCTLVQYRTANSLCRKCSKPLPAEEIKPLRPPVVEVEAKTEPEPEIFSPTSVVVGLPKVFRDRRLSLNLSRGKFITLGFTRAYVAKLEKGTIPNFFTFQRYARGLHTRGSSLLAMIENPHPKLLEPLPCCDEAISKHIGSVLRRLRDESEKSREEFVLALGVSSSVWWRWETGKGLPTLPFFERFASVIGKPLSIVIAEIENAACSEI